MSFDFFNTSYLAFGSKLYAAFVTLENLVKEAEDNLKQVKSDQGIYDEYLNKNYQVPKPATGSAPCRVNELFDIVNDKPVYIRKIQYVNGVLSVDVGLFNRSNNRITRLTGSTGAKSGYCYYSSEAVSNTNPERELKFVDNISKVRGTVLFEYRIDSSDVINIVGSVSNLFLIPSDISQYTSMSLGKRVATIGSYTTQDYECLCIIGKENDILVKLNGTTILKGQGRNNVRHCIVYAKKGATISGTYAGIYRINYSH